MAKASEIHAILESLGPSLSSKVKARLIASGISEEAARQRISRANYPVCKLYDIRFPKKETFLYLASQFRSPNYYDNLIDALTSTNSSYGIAIHGLLSKGGAVPKSSFRIVSGAPEKLKSQLSIEHITERLVKTGLVTQEVVDSIGECYFLTKGEIVVPQDMIHDLRAKLVVEDLLLFAVSDWLKKIGLASYNVIKTRSYSEAASYGSFAWDISAPSYIYPIAQMRQGNVRPGFVVVDVSIGQTINENQASFFLKKTNHLRSMKKIYPFVSIYVADAFTQGAYMLGKKSGSIFTTPEILFGSSIASSLKQLLATLNDAARAISLNPDAVFKLFDELSKIEGAAGNLRGILFEMIVGDLVKKGEGGYIDLGKIIRVQQTGNKAEIDVWRFKGNHEISIYECKGRLATSRVTLDEVKTWLEKKVPVIYQWMKQNRDYSNLTPTFELWTTGVIDPDAISFLSEKKNILKKYKICWKNGDEVFGYAQKINASSVIKTLNEHYRKHPLAADL